MASRHWAFVVGLATLAACSVVNSFDDVKTELDDAAGNGGDGGSFAGKAGSSSGGVGTEGGAPPSQGGGGDMGDMGGLGGTGPLTAPTTGLVVLGGTQIEDDELGAGVLTVLDPASGQVLVSEPLGEGAAIVAIGYDPNTHLWYFFTSSSFPADANSKADLQIRSYDDASHTWTIVAKVTALPPPQPNGLLVLNDRLAYLSYEVDGGIQNAVTLLDTSDPRKVVPISYAQPDLPGTAVGIVGSRGAPGDDTVLGGTVAVALASGCSGVEAQRTCKSLSFVPIFVGDAVSSGLAVDFGPFGGVPGLTSARGVQRAFVALPSTMNGNVKVVAFDPRTPSLADSQLAPTNARWIGGMTFADCEEVAVISTVDAGNLLALTSAGLATSTNLGHAGQVVQYDPFTRRLALAFHPQSNVFPPSAGEGGAGGGGGAVTASVEAVLPSRNGANVSLTKVDAASWSPPEGIAIDIVATRFPAGFDCTQ